MNGNDARKAQAVKEFLGWLSGYSPELYAAAMEQFPEVAAALSTPSHMEGIDGFGFGQVPVAVTAQAAATEKPSIWDRVIEGVTSLGTAYLQFEAQKDVLDVQMERAKQGLPPIKTDAYAPAIRHVVDVPPEVRKGAMGVGTLALLGAGAVFLFWAMNR